MKASDAYLPKLIENNGPVTVKIGNSAPQSPSAPLHIDASGATNLIPLDEFVVKTDLRADCKRKSDHDYVPLDEIMQLYSAPVEDGNSCISSEDSLLYSKPSISDQSTKRKKHKRREEKVTKNPIITDGSPEPSRLPAFPSSVTHRSKALSEYALFSSLKAKYTFGCFGTTLYVRGSNGVYSEVTKDVVASLLYETLTEEQKMSLNIMRSTAVREWLRNAPEIKSNQLVFPRKKVLFVNGYFNILDEAPAKMKDEDFIVTRINASYLPHEELTCPCFDAYLESTSGGDESIKRRICAMIGYLLLPGYPGKKILVLGTAKDSGKSMISRFIQTLVGQDQVSGQSPFEMTERHALSEFSGRSVNMALDIPATVLKPATVSLMKTLSGGDLVSINPKGKDRYSQVCYAKQVLGTNAPISLQQYDEAFWTRITIIPYLYSIRKEDQIYNLEGKLMKERDAIVTRCMQEAKELIENGYEFPECPVAEEMKDAWIGWQPYAAAFLDSFCSERSGSFTSTRSLYFAYLKYCEAHGFPTTTEKGLISYAKSRFPNAQPGRTMINSIQSRGLSNLYMVENF